MQEDWMTEANDLEIAEEIINKHIELNEGEPLGLFEITLYDEKNACCEVADCLIELAEHFNDLYGVERGSFVTKKIIARCMIGEATIH